MKVPKNKAKNLLKCTSVIARALIMAEKAITRPVRRSSKNEAVSLTPVSP